MDNLNYRNPSFGVSEAVVGKMVRKVYLWMSAALAITGLTAYYVAATPSILEWIFTNRGVFIGLIIAEFALVIAVSAAINKLSAATATLVGLSLQP